MFKDFKVEFIGANGNRNYRMFDEEKQAMRLYEKCNGEAIVKKYNPETFEYEVIKDVKQTARKKMEIADNLKCKDFVIKGEWAGSRLAGQENLWIYRVYYNGTEIKQKYPATTKTEARAFISAKVKKVNAILNKARKLQA